MINRDDVLRISRAVIFGGLTVQDVETILVSYCLEQGKPHSETIPFVTFLIEHEMFESCFIQALQYYEKKYTITKLQSKPNDLGQRKTILIN